VALQLDFLGGAGTVTGSKYALQNGRDIVLVDCGLFQGFKTLRLKNWAPLPIDPRKISAVVLTHAHLDHSGYLPLLVRNGFRGHIFTSRPTLELCRILLPDSGFLQEKDAEFANRHGFSKHKPALPLYTMEDAKRSLDYFKPVSFDDDHALTRAMSFRMHRAGHILGAASLQIEAAGTTVVFSGDLGRYNDPTMVDPVGFDRADYLVVESTYGDRRHPDVDPEDTIGNVVEATIGRGGTVVIPAFAVGRTQSLLFHLAQLKDKGRLTNVPVFLDSPMAQDASDIFCDGVGEHRLSMSACRRACGVARFVRSVEESKALMTNPMPKVIISASGMATGGRVLHHLKHYAPDPRNTILFAGFQAGGTRGASMIGGADSIKIHGAYVPVRAEVKNLDMLSGHADAGEILRWLRGFKSPPKMTFITHGEPAASDTLRRRIEEELKWSCTVPEHGQQVGLT
jgi:metallo-beta-lactamase family protein